MSVLNFDDLKALAPNDGPETKDVPVPKWGGKSVRLKKLEADGLIEIFDLWADLPKDEAGMAKADASSLVRFYETLLDYTAIDAAGARLFAGDAGKAILRKFPDVLMFLGSEAQKFNGHLLMVDKEKKSELPLEISVSSSAESLDTPSSTQTTSCAS